MPEVLAHLFETHPVVDEGRRCRVADPMGAEVGERPASRAIPAAEHEGEGVHREGPGLSGPRGKEEPARIVGWPQIDGGGTEEGSSAVVEIRTEGCPRILV